MELLTRIGYDLIINEVEDESRVLDLGCGDGVLLIELQQKKKVKGFGVEISEEGVSQCVEKAFSVTTVILTKVFLTTRIIPLTM
jgi:methionine biosynthesis protein MetW